MYPARDNTILLLTIWTKVLILDGNSEHVAQAWTKKSHFGLKHPICDYSRSNQMP